MPRVVCQVPCLPKSPESICGSTDLPPLTLTVVTLEQTLVVRDTVLAEHEPRYRKKVELSARLSAEAIDPTHVALSVDRRRLHHRLPEVCAGLG